MSNGKSEVKQPRGERVIVDVNFQQLYIDGMQDTCGVLRQIEFNCQIESPPRW